MGTGHGYLQRKVLALLRIKGHLDTFELAGLAYEIEPDAQNCVMVSDAQLASIKRALASLAREGLVVPRGRMRGGRQEWASPEYAKRDDARLVAAGFRPQPIRSPELRAARKAAMEAAKRRPAE